MKVRNQHGEWIWENTFQVYEMFIVCLDTDGKSFS